MSRERLKRLQKILKLETRNRERAQRELAECINEESAIKGQISELEKERSRALEPSSCDLAMRLSLISFLEKLNSQTIQLQSDLKAIHEQVESKRDALRKQHTKVKSWERVIEQTRLELEHEQRRLEMIDADERYLSQQTANPTN